MVPWSAMDRADRLPAIFSPAFKACANGPHGAALGLMHSSQAASLNYAKKTADSHQFGDRLVFRMSTLLRQLYRGRQ